MSNAFLRWVSILLLAGPFVVTAPAMGDDRSAPHTWVDPFIGTANSGNTFPGAVRPWGMVSVSPHTDPGSPSGYTRGADAFLGLGHAHLSGTGCAELGSVILTACRDTLKTTPGAYRCSFGGETAQPGYYAATLLEPHVRVEATATVRCGISRFIALEDGDLYILLDAGRNLTLAEGGAVQFVSSQELRGYNTGGGFCGEANRHRVYFSAQIDRSPQALGTWRDGVASTNRHIQAASTPIGAWMLFQCSAGDTIEVRVGISYVSHENARINLDRETSEKTFATLRAEATAEWDSALSCIVVEGGSPEDRTRFYTALYHSLLHPNIVSDITGAYPLHGTTAWGAPGARPRYTVFSLWDTYRTLHPLLTLIYPDRQEEMVVTMLDLFDESGWLPKWELLGNETYMMVGDPAVPVVADTYLKGIVGFDTLKAFEAITKAATVSDSTGDPSRPGYRSALELGYIPSDQDTTEAWWVWGPVSTTLEYCLADWTIARVAARMGRPDIEQEFQRRSLFYRNLFDPETMFLRPRRRDGAWATPFDPLATEGSGSWTGSGGPGFVEGNAWQYTWFVPHDITGLAHLFPSESECLDKLEECLTQGHFTITNEPDIAFPYLFTYFSGHQSKTAGYVWRIMQESFSTGPAGLPGNDDAGTLSAWFVFSSLGIYPACPGSGDYRLGIPLFERATLRLDPRYYPGGQLTIERTGSPGSAPRIHTILWNGTKLGEYALSHGQITRGGVLQFELEP